MKNPVMYIIANKGAGMSPGKLAAQVAHAAVKSFQLSLSNDLGIEIEEWDNSGHTKIVLEARDAEHLLAAERYLNGRGISTVIIIDEGRTEVPPLTPTALGIELLDKADPDVVFSMSSFKTYKAEPELIPLPESAYATPNKPRWWWRLPIKPSWRDPSR